MRRLEVFPNADVPPGEVALREAVAHEADCHEGEPVVLRADGNRAARLPLRAWRAASPGEVGPDGCLVHPDTLAEVEALCPDRLVVLESARPPQPTFYVFTWSRTPGPGDGSDDLPEDLIVLVDTSGSMAGAPLRHAQRALFAFADQKREMARTSARSDRLGLVTFGGEGSAGVDVACPPVGPEDEYSPFVDAVGRLRVGGLTPMAEALERGHELVAGSGEDSGEVGAGGGAGPRRSRRRRLILLSDGHPCPGSAEEVHDLALRLADDGVYVATVGVGEFFDRRLLMTLAARTGAPFLEAQSIRRLPRLLEELA